MGDVSVAGPLSATPGSAASGAQGTAVAVYAISTATEGGCPPQPPIILARTGPPAPSGDHTVELTGSLHALDPPLLGLEPPAGDARPPPLLPQAHPRGLAEQHPGSRDSSACADHGGRADPPTLGLNPAATSWAPCAASPRPQRCGAASASPPVTSTSPRLSFAQALKNKINKEAPGPSSSPPSSTPPSSPLQAAVPPSPEGVPAHRPLIQVLTVPGLEPSTRPFDVHTAHAYFVGAPGLDRSRPPARTEAPRRSHRRSNSSSSTRD